MAEKDNNNDEYHFAELDTPGMESMDEMESEGSRTGPPPEAKNVRLNALIVVGVVLLLFFTYRFIWPLFSGSKDVVKTTPAPVAQVKPVEPIQTQPAPVVTTPTPAPVQPVIQATDDAVKRSVSVLEINQQSLRSDVTSLNSQVNGLNRKIDDLASEMIKLNQTITNLSNQMAQQSHEMNQLMAAKTQPKPVKHIIKRPIPQIRYHIQAVIPGRAWLIGSNGSILTVREGIKIRGYGTVQLIDSMQGRVVTSSGKIIRFSPEDS